MKVEDLKTIKWLKKEVDALETVRSDLSKRSEGLNSQVYKELTTPNQKLKVSEIDAEISELIAMLLLKETELVAKYKELLEFIENIEDTPIRILLRYLYISGFTQTAIAVKMGVSVRTLLRWHDEFFEINDYSVPHEK